MKRALFIGRFQPFHNGHLHVAKSLSKKFDELIIGIGSSREKNTSKNPFSYNERKVMIAKTLKNSKILNFRIFPVPDLHDDIRWADYILKNLPKFDASYSGNGWTIRCFKKKSIPCTKIRLLKGVNGTKIRMMANQKENWEKLVPKEIFRYIKNHRCA